MTIFHAGRFRGNKKATKTHKNDVKTRSCNLKSPYGLKAGVHTRTPPLAWSPGFSRGQWTQIFCWTPARCFRIVRAVITVLGRVFSPELLGELEQQKGSLSRRGLAKLVCERLDWKDSKGRLQLMSARKAVSQLHHRGIVQLPASTFVWPKRRPVEKLPPSPQALCATLADVGPVQLILVGGRRGDEARLWRQTMEHHYLGAGPLCGAQLRYLIQSPRGCLGALAFSAPALRVRGRDTVIGWSEETRRHQLHRVVNNSRLLILPWIEVPHLASHVLALAARRLPEDWQERYGIRPVLLETFVEADRFQGVCYQAAGWQCVGQTAGRGRQDRTHAKRVPIKSIWIKPLHPQWQEVLRMVAEPPRLAPLREPPAAAPKAAPVDWAEEEMSGAALGDLRLSRRLVDLTRDFFARPSAQIPEACGSKAKTKAAYRFFDQRAVNLQNILAPHREQTLRRARQQSVVLAVQDTTELDYTAHPQTEGLGPIGNHRAHVQGLLLHPTLALTPSGAPLGLLDVQCWVRDPEEQKKFRQPVENKESVKWLKSFTAAEAAQALCPETMIVSVGDSEADMYELFLKAEGSPARLLVRAWRERFLEESGAEVWTHLRSLRAAGLVRLKLPRRGSHKAREVELSVRFSSVSLRPPDYLKKAASVTLWAILLREETPPPQGGQAVEWLLLTNVPVTTLEQAVEKVRWYAQRFQIEVYFRTLKSGCRIEDRQLGAARRLENCLAIDMVVAWRVLQLKQQAREEPEASCTLYFDDAQCEVLTALPGRTQSSVPTLREGIRLIAMLGGFLARKSDGEPGAQTLWRGLQRLDDVVLGFTLARAYLGGPVPRTTDYG